MPTPQQQREYGRLSGMLQAIGMKHRSELPPGTLSLSLTLGGGELVVEAYDRAGKMIGTIPNQKTLSLFASDLQRAFGGETFTDDAIIAIV